MDLLRRRPNGYTITEAIIASFLLVGAILVVSRLFHASLRYSAWVENKAVATHLAEKRMADVRRWALTQTNWASPPTGNEPGFTNFTVNVSIQAVNLFDPSSVLESGYASQRFFDEAVRKAVVTVSWGSGNSVKLVSLLKDPPRAWRTTNPVLITGAPGGTINSGVVVNLTATGYDTTNTPIKDLCFTWSVEPDFTPGPAALGTVTPGRNGYTAVFQNSRLVPGGAPVASTGKCIVRATAIFNGQERVGSTATLSLAP